MSAGISRDDWLTALNGAAEPHPGAQTVAELCALTGASDRSMRRRLHDLEAAGQVTRTWKFQRTAQTERLKVVAYVLHDAPARKKRR